MRAQLLVRRKMQAVVQLDFKSRGEGRFTFPLPSAAFSRPCLMAF